MSQPFYKKAGVQAAIVAGVFLLIVTTLTILHNTKNGAGSSNTMKVSGVVKSPVTQINQPSNSVVNNDSGNITLNNQGGQNNQQAPLYAPGSTFNYYSTPISNTITREAFETFEGLVSNAMSNTTERIELTTQQVQLLAQALRDLDQRTSDIEKLPDGRTKFGGYISGKPKILFEAFDAGLKNYTNNNFQAALEDFQKVIHLFESPLPSGIVMVSGGNISQKGKTAAYWYAGVCAQMVHSNKLAKEFAVKAFKDFADPQTKALLITSLANLALDEMRNNNLSDSFQLFSEAITNYESIKSSTNTVLDQKTLINFYGSAASVAFRIGKTNEAIQYANEVQKLLEK